MSTVWVLVGVGVTAPVAAGMIVSVGATVSVGISMSVAVGCVGVMAHVGVGAAAAPGRKRISPQPFVAIHISPFGPTVMASISLLTSGELSGVQLTQVAPSVKRMPPITRPTVKSSSWPSRFTSMPPRDVPTQITLF
jgi:hypothetical protein